MFTIPSYRRINSHLNYVVNVINIDQPDCMGNPVHIGKTLHIDDAVKMIEDYRELYLTSDNIRLFVEISTNVHCTDVVLESFWLDKD